MESLWLILCLSFGGHTCVSLWHVSQEVFRDTVEHPVRSLYPFHLHQQRRRVLVAPHLCFQSLGLVCLLHFSHPRAWVTVCSCALNSPFPAAQ